MKRKTFSLILTVLVLTVTTTLHSQFLSASRTGVGINTGVAKIYGGLKNFQGDPVQTGFAGAMEGYARYAISPRFFLVGALGYSELSDGSFIVDPKATFSTDVVNLDLKAAVNLLTNSRFTPFGYVGLGAIWFKQDHANALPGSYFDPAYFFGGGIETKISPQLGLNATVDYRFTGSDDLDPEAYKGSAKDGYLTIRTGLTYYLEPARFGLGKEIEVSEKNPIDELDSTELSGAGEKGEANSDELSALIEGIDNYGEASDSNLKMDEYVNLKSKAEKLNDAVKQKELEIEELKSQLSVRKNKIADLHGRPGVSSSIITDDYSDINASYNEALQSFYSRDYDTAIQQFNLLLETSPENKLASNCQYWIGECYFGKRNYASAAEALDKVLSYQKSNKKDDALLMLGRCYIKLGDKQLAIQMFNQLMNGYPDSEYFEKAQRYASRI